MPLLDLSSISRMLIRLISEVITVSPAWDGSTPTISPLPPDRLGEAGDVLGLYLYHLVEDAHVRNDGSPTGGPTPVALAPMGLVLHYQLSAHTTATVDSPDGAYTAQRLFGLAVKALHDHPSITDATEVNGVRLLAAYGLEGRENQLRVALRQLPVEEAVTYWTAGQGPARLAAYYQVSIVLLEPEAAARRSASVLERRVTALVGGPPHLSGSRSLVTFTPPGSPGPRTLAFVPAQVPIGGRFTLLGSDLVGDATDLLLERRGWELAQTVDPVAWSLVVTATELSATAQAVAGAEDVVPGVYAAAVQVRRAARDREVALVSNRTAIVITPVVSNPGALSAAAGGLLLLTGSLFQHADIPTDPASDRAVQVIVGVVPLALDDDGAVAPGEFEVVDATTLRLRLPAGLPAGVLPLRVRVNGAESPPRWVEVTA